MKNAIKRTLAAALILALALAMTACGGGKKESAASVDLAAVLAQFKLGEEMMTLTPADLAQLYYIDEADIKQSAAAMHTSGINCDEIILIEAVDAEAAGRVKSILDARYQSKLNEMRDYLPDQYAIIESCQVTQNGNFVAMIVAPNASELTDIYNKSFQ